uniref:Uncharacterized protein n=1 Tax=Arundo donax TaxID=35708 RepID=A0A0A9C578_ARUDO
MIWRQALTSSPISNRFQHLILQFLSKSSCCISQLRCFISSALRNYAIS